MTLFAPIRHPSAEEWKAKLDAVLARWHETIRAEPKLSDFYRACAYDEATRQLVALSLSSGDAAYLLARPYQRAKPKKPLTLSP